MGFKFDEQTFQHKFCAGANHCYQVFYKGNSRKSILLFYFCYSKFGMIWLKKEGVFTGFLAVLTRWFKFYQGDKGINIMKEICSFSIGLCIKAATLHCLIYGEG
jgi:hypothetical protein